MQEILTKTYEILKDVVASCQSDCIALSGGLDSSILAYFLMEKKPKAFTVIAKDFLATDLTYCQLIAREFKLDLNMITVPTDELLSAVEQTIKILKVFNDIEIRNAVVMYLTLSEIKKKNHAGIITGDGADELFAGYNFFLKNNNEEEIQKDLQRIWDIMHFPTRSLGNALGVRVESPFLNEDLVKYAKSIPVNLKVRSEGKKRYGKWILRKLFEDKLPKSVVWRDKSPMQDGSGTAGLSGLFDVLIQDETYETRKKKIQQEDNVIIRTKESLHYYDIYRKHFECPSKLPMSDTGNINSQSNSGSNCCPFCQHPVEPDSKFCRMCGSFPI